MTTRRFSWRWLPALALAVGLGGCAPPAPSAVPAASFAWDVTASPSSAPVAPDGAGTPALPGAPSPSAAPVPSGGGPGGPGGAGPSYGAMSEVALAATAAAEPGADGLTVPLQAGLMGPVTYAAEGWITSTLVVPAGAGPITLHPRQPVGAPRPSGSAVLQGSLGADGAGLVMRYMAVPGPAFANARADQAGGFSFSVPVDGTAQGLLVASDRSEGPALALARVSVTEGQTLAVARPTLAAPIETVAAPGVPAGMRLTASRLAAIEGPAAAPTRLDLLAFSVGRVPRYELSGFTLASVFEARAPGDLAGSEVVTTGASAPEFLAAPDPSGLPATLEPGMVLRWPAVPGASLYSLHLQHAGDASPFWEGATPDAAIRLPASLPLGEKRLELSIQAWSASEVSIYSVASARALRVPAVPASAGSRHSWALRRGLSS